MISREQAEDAIVKVAVGRTGTRKSWEGQDILTLYIRQQEKVSKLLELYKELSDSIIDNVAFLNEDEKDVIEQIKSIEEEKE